LGKPRLFGRPRPDETVGKGRSTASDEPKHGGEVKLPLGGLKARYVPGARGGTKKKNQGAWAVGKTQSKDNPNQHLTRMGIEKK